MSPCKKSLVPHRARGLAAILLLACASAWGAPPDAYLRWRFVGQEKVQDGGNRISFALESPPGRLPWETLEVIRRSFPMRRPGSGDPDTPPEIHRLAVAPDAMEIVLYSGRPERIELDARAAKDGETYYARTLVYAFGESGRGDPGGERLDADAAPRWPGFDLVTSGGRYFRAQAGSEVVLRTESPLARVDVFDEGNPAVTLPANAEGRYGYAPLDDPELRKSWRAVKSLVFAAELPEARTRFSFHLPVYRGYYARLDYRGGLVTLAASALAALAWVFWRGRRFPWR